MTNPNVKTKAVLIAGPDANYQTHKVGAILVNQLTGWEFILLNPEFDYKNLPRQEGKSDVVISVVWMKGEHPNKPFSPVTEYEESDFIPTTPPEVSKYE